MAGTLSRDEMERIIAEGGSVVYKGAVLSHPSHLPSAAELAAGDAEKTAAVRQAIEAQRSALDAQLAEMDRQHVVKNAAAEGDETERRAKPRPQQREV